MGLMEVLDRAVEKRGGAVTRNDNFSPLTPEQAKKLLNRYLCDVELWNRFWQFMKEQSAQGASFEYVYQCYQNLESAWEEESASGNRSREQSPTAGVA